MTPAAGVWSGCICVALCYFVHFMTKRVLDTQIEYCKAAYKRLQADYVVALEKIRDQQPAFVAYNPPRPLIFTAPMTLSDREQMSGEDDQAARLFGGGSGSI